MLSLLLLRRVLWLRTFQLFRVAALKKVVVFDNCASTLKILAAESCSADDDELLSLARATDALFSRMRLRRGLSLVNTQDDDDSARVVVGGKSGCWRALTNSGRLFLLLLLLICVRMRLDVVVTGLYRESNDLLCSI